MNFRPESWKRRVTNALVLVVLIAVGARVAWDLLAPLVPMVLVVIGLVTLFGLLVSRR
jgi:hypothetical protein